MCRATSILPPGPILNIWRFLLFRLLGAVPTLLAIIVLAFTLLRAAPGGPFDNEKEITPEIRASIERTYHLDEPLPMQFVRYVGGLLRGDLGPSFQYPDTSVNQLIAEGLPVDLKIGGLALLLACLLGIPLGGLAAMRRGGMFDRLAATLSLVGISIPVYVTAPVLILVFAVTLQWLPAGDWGGGPVRNMVCRVALRCVIAMSPLMRASSVCVKPTPYALKRGLASCRVFRQRCGRR